jgi:glycosyltransferase involved in cell wall biosynthesis
MRVMFLTQWFEPEPIMKGAAFARALADAGHHVEVVTGFPNYPTGRIYPGYRVGLFQKEIIDGIAVNRLPLYPSHNKSSLGRAMNYLSFFLSVLIYGLWAARRFDVVYVYHPPITVGAAAALFGLINRRPFVVDIQDLWPDSVAASGMFGTGAISNVLDGICNFVYRRAAAIVTQSHGFEAKLIERGVPPAKLTTIYNWADEALTRPSGHCDAAVLVPRGRFNVVYGGNIGRAQALDAVVRAAKLAMDRSPGIQLTLIGNGVERDNLRRLVTEIGAHNVKIAPGVPKSEIADILAAADVLLVHLADDPLFEITIPSKIQFYLAMGKPILIGMKGEAAKLVSSAGAGVTVPPEDIEAIARAMIELSQQPAENLRAMGEKGKSFYERRLSVSAAIEATIRVIDSVALQRK